jgi:hypothetical protein
MLWLLIKIPQIRKFESNLNLNPEQVSTDLMYNLNQKDSPNVGVLLHLLLL